MNLLSLAFDGGLAVLLVLTIGYCARLSGRIRQMQDAKGEFAGMISQFDQATGRAVSSMAELQTHSKRITDALQLKIEKANFLADDLAFLIEKSSKLATQLEQAKLQNESASSKPKPSAQQHPLFQAATALPPSPAKPKIASYITPLPQANNVPTSVTSAASLEALLNRLASPNGTSSPAITKPVGVTTSQPQPQTARTSAERELLDALKTGR